MIYMYYIQPEVERVLEFVRVFMYIFNSITHQMVPRELN